MTRTISTHDSKESWLDFKARIKDNETFKRVKEYFPQLNFITIHYTYFITMCLVTSVIFWGSSDPAKSISYTDSLFLVVSAMTEAGLNTVNLSQMTTWQQIMLWLLILIGSSIFVSIGTVLTRKRVFESRFKNIVRAQKANRMRRRTLSNVSMMNMARGKEVPVAKRLDAQQKVAEPVDGSNFESRHSGPRDPTEGIAPGDLVTRMESPNHIEKQGENVANGSGSGSGSPALEKGGGGESAIVDDDVFIPRGREADLDQDQISTMHYAPPTGPEHRRVLSFVGVGAHPHSTAYQLPHSEGLLNRIGKKAQEKKNNELENLSKSQYPTYLTRRTTGRNAQFFGLSRAEREHLGGVEYRAISLLAWVVPVYFALWQFLGCVGLGAYMAHNKAATSYGNGINPWWLGIFNGVSAFNNSGMSLLDANMIPFQNNIYPLITMGLMILAGNTAYPLFLRLILWTFLKLLCLIYPDSEVHSEHKATLRFILQYPRRVYTNLFPSAPTWWLLLMVIVLNGIDWAAFELLNIRNPATETIPTHYRVLDGLFQALAVRSGGFYVVNISTLRIGLQVLYVIMMYISVYPVVITMRHSNVYEERSLGIYADDSDSDSASQPPKLGSSLFSTLRRTFTSAAAPFSTQPIQRQQRSQFVRQQIRGQLSHDMWWLVLAILFISCIEVSNFDRDPVTYSVFNITFEVVSGYGCVGISTGLPNEAYSFSGGWHKASKLILCAVMLRGRHRGLPVALDRAVRLPDDPDRLGSEEEQDFQLRRSMSMSMRRQSMNAV